MAFHIRRHDVIVVAKGEPAGLGDAAGKVHTVIVGALTDLARVGLLYAIPVVGPSAGHLVERSHMVAHSSVDSTVAADAAVQSSQRQRQETALARTRHAQIPPVPLSPTAHRLKVVAQGSDEVDGTNGTGNNVAVIILVAVVQTVLPVVGKGSGKELVIIGLLLRHGNAVDTNFKHDDALRCRPLVAGIGPHASPRHPQQGGIAAMAARAH